MNTRIIVSLALFGLLAIAGTLSSQSFSIDWHKVAGGGGSSSGGPYSLSGTIGQPDAGAMSGGNYMLVGGFWALPVAVQTPGAPTLNIAPTAPGFATIWWAANQSTFHLQQSDTLTPPAWINAPSGATNPVTVPATLPTRCARRPADKFMPLPEGHSSAGRRPGVAELEQ